MLEVASALIALVMLAAFAAIIWGVLTGNGYKGRRAANRIVRKIAASTDPAGTISLAPKYEWWHGKRVVATWPLWFDGDQTGEPASHLVLRTNDDSGGRIQLLAGNSHMRLAVCKSWSWTRIRMLRWPDSIFVENRREMQKSAAFWVENCLRHQANFSSAADLLNDFEKGRQFDRGIMPPTP